MKRWTKMSWCMCAMTIAVFAALSGCQQGGSPSKKTTDTKHAHPTEGPHGGMLLEWGADDEYHVEFIVDHDAKQVVCYILDGTAKKAPDIAADKITEVKAVILSETPPLSIDLKHDKAKSGKEGIAFTGTHEFFAKKQEFKVDVSGLVNGKSYNDPTPDTYKPKKDKAASLRELYGKPGGIYTEADIRKNGTVPAAEKYKDREWAHDDNLRPGDKVCPVSKSKAEKDCAWFVQGQRYEFCCSPCIDKFLRQAHDQPEKIKNANEYVYKPM